MFPLLYRSFYISVNSRSLPIDICTRVLRFRENGIFLPIKIQVSIPPSLSTRNRHRCIHLQQHIINHLQKITPTHTPALTVVEQAPIRSKSILVEVFGIEKHTATPKYAFFEGLPYVELEDERQSKQIWSSAYIFPYEKAQSKFHSPAFTATSKNFIRMDNWIKHLGLSWDHVIRQWNYIGQILDKGPSPFVDLQNYQEFNAAREQYYASFKSQNLYPAATGIGTSFPGVIMDVVLCVTPSSYENKALQSPIQSEAFDYSANVLVGKSAKKPPLFSRARIWGPSSCVSVPATLFFQCMQCWISGTASIEGEKTIDPQDAILQIKNTLRFIDDLVATAKAGQGRFNRVKLYIKSSYKNDIQPLIDLLYTRYEQNICSVVYADICRDNLWIEIEADTTLGRTVLKEE